MSRPWLFTVVAVLALARAGYGSVLDVTSFGAVADDANSDSGAIAAAIAASRAGDTVFFPTGTYRLSAAIQPASGTTLAGAARDATILRYDGAALLPLIDLGGRSNVEITALTLDGAGNPKAANGIQALDGGGHRLHGLAIRGLVKGQGFGPHGIHFVQNVSDSEITDNWISNIAPTSAWGAGIRLSHGSARNQVLRNTISTTGRGGILADNDSVDLVIRDNLVSGSGGDGLGIEIWGGSHRAIIEDNVIDHWLSINESDFCAVRRNVVRDPGGPLKYIGIELAGGSNAVFTDNAVGDGQQLGLSVSNTTKDNVLWAFNTVASATTWNVQLQGDADGLTHHYFYGNTFLGAQHDDPRAAYPDSGHGFRLNGDCRAVTLDHNRIVDNGADGIQFSGAHFDQLSFLDNLIARNVGDSVSRDPGGSDLLWAGNTVSGNGLDQQLTTRGFAASAPAAAFSAIDFAIVGAPVVFTNNSSVGSGSIVRTLWDFGDGVPTTDSQPTHSYDRPGIYRVTLVVWSSAGRAARAAHVIQVAASADSTCATLDCRAGGDECHFPACDETASSCVGEAKPAGTTCDDGLFCTAVDGCDNGLCTGRPRDCSDDDRCTSDSCDESGATCAHTAIASCGPQSPTQQSCLVAMAKSYQKLAKASAKRTADCVSAAAKGAPDPLACSSRDPRGKVAAALAKLQSANGQRCTCPTCTLPTFGYASDVFTAAGNVDAASSLIVTDLFGSTEGLGLLEYSANGAGASCQQHVYRDAQAVGAAYWTAFTTCARDGLRGKVPPAAVAGQSFVLGDELARCLGLDPKGKIARARARLAASATACAAAGIPFDSFAGSCGAETSAATFAACVADLVEQRTAAAIRTAHDL